PAPAADFHQPLDVHRDFLAQVALDAALFLDHPADLPDVVFREVLDADVGAHARRRQDVVRALAADPENVGQADFDPLGPRKIHSSNATLLPFPLLVFLFRADPAPHAAAADDLALVTDSLARRSALHLSLRSVAPRRSGGPEGPPCRFSTSPAYSFST